MLRRLTAAATLLALASPALAGHNEPVSGAQTPAYTGAVTKPAGSTVTMIPAGSIAGSQLATGAAVANGALSPTGSGASLTGITPAQVGALNKAGDTMTGTLGLPVFTATNASPVVIDQYDNPPSDMVAATGGGPYISFYGLPGHIPGDSERTAFQINSTSKTGPSVEETALNVAMNDTQGYTAAWVANTSYPAGILLHSGVGYPTNIYANAGACTSATSGSGPTGAPWAISTSYAAGAVVIANGNQYQTSAGGTSAASGSGPSGSSPATDGTVTWTLLRTGTAIPDGSCSWTYQSLDNDGKSGMLLSGRARSGGGQIWGGAFDVVADGGALGAATNTPGGWMVGLEIDTSNYARDCPVGAPPYCQVTALFLAGGSTMKGTAGILGGGQAAGSETYHQGVTLLPGFASDVGFNAATGNVGFQSNGTHGAYAFQDLSTSPTSIAIGGAHSYAGVVDNVSNIAFYSSGTHGASAFKDDSTAPTSIQISGTHSAYTFQDTSTSPTAVSIGGAHSYAGVLDSVSAIGFYSTGTHSANAFKDDSSAPTSVLISGSHSFAAYADNSTSSVGIDLLGTYGTQISAKGFSVDASGNVAAKSQQLTPVTIATLPTCNTAAKGMIAFVSDTVGAAAPAWHGAVTGGGSTTVNSPVSCTGTGWQYD